MCTDTIVIDHKKHLVNYRGEASLFIGLTDWTLTSCMGLNDAPTGMLFDAVSIGIGCLDEFGMPITRLCHFGRAILIADRVLWFAGNYDTYVKTKKELDINQAKLYKKQQGGCPIPRGCPCQHCRCCLRAAAVLLRKLLASS